MMASFNAAMIKFYSFFPSVMPILFSIFSLYAGRSEQDCGLFQGCSKGMGKDSPLEAGRASAPCSCITERTQESHSRMSCQSNCQTCKGCCYRGSHFNLIILHSWFTGSFLCYFKVRYCVWSWFEIYIILAMFVFAGCKVRRSHFLLC
jgi:hypothetical protein